MKLHDLMPAEVQHWKNAIDADAIKCSLEEFFKLIKNYDEYGEKKADLPVDVIAHKYVVTKPLEGRLDRFDVCSCETLDAAMEIARLLFVHDVNALNIQVEKRYNG